MSYLGDRIREHRQRMGLKQDELAERARISKGFLSDLENGNTSVGADKLLDIARVLGVSLDSLMQEEQIQPSMREVQIPASLAALAKQENLTFIQALTLLDMQRQIVAHRSLTSKKPDLEDVDWRKFYESVKEFI